MVLEISAIEKLRDNTSIIAGTGPRRRIVKLQPIYNALGENKVQAIGVCAQNKNAARSRIDYILLSNHLINSLSKINVITAPVPDHKSVVIDLKLNPQKRGKGYW